jgi:hypothetical protein
VGKREDAAARLGCDLDAWLTERRTEGCTWPEIAEEIHRRTRIRVSAVSVRNWGDLEAARSRSRDQVARYRERYGIGYESKGRNRAARRALRMFREEHPDIWQRLLDEECGRFRALSVAREASGG